MDDMTFYILMTVGISVIVAIAVVIYFWVLTQTSGNIPLQNRRSTGSSRGWRSRL